MLHYENCRTFGKKFHVKPTDIVIENSLVYIDYAANWQYWTDRLNEKPYCTAIDREGNKYTIYRNFERNLATAIPKQE